MREEQKDRLAELRLRWNTRPYGSDLSLQESQELRTLSRLEEREDQAEFGADYDWMVALLYKNDPMGLAGAGVPPDEYETEARMILHAVKELEEQTLGNILQTVFGVFDTMFGHSEDDDAAGSISDLKYLLISQSIFRRYSAVSECR